MPSASSSTSARPPSALAEPLPCQRGGGDLWFSELPAELEQAKACCRARGGEIFHQRAITARKRPRGRPSRIRPDAGKGHRSRAPTQRGNHASVHP